MDKMDQQHLDEYRKEFKHLEYRIEAVTRLITELEKKEKDGGLAVGALNA